MKKFDISLNLQEFKILYFFRPIKSRQFTLCHKRRKRQLGRVRARHLRRRNQIIGQQAHKRLAHNAQTNPESAMATPALHFERRSPIPNSTRQPAPNQRTATKRPPKTKQQQQRQRHSHTTLQQL